MQPPETRYVSVNGSEVAYQITGQPGPDLLFCYGLGSHIGLVWDNPAAAAFLERLASFSRLLLFDRRGTGASDALPPEDALWEGLAEDMVSVLRVAASHRANVLATLDTGPIAMLFASSHPELVHTLTLVHTTSCDLGDDDYQGASLEQIDMLVDFIASNWGTPDLLRLVQPSAADDPQLLQLMGKMNRASATPSSVRRQYEYFMKHVDVRKALPLIQAPTLVMQAAESPFMPPDHAHYIADHIAGARFVELPGADVGMMGDEAVNELARQITGEQPVFDIERILTTVLFTDIVPSTEHAARLGDHQWRELLDAHDRVVREQLHQFRGKEIKATGDGFLASFDGPARAVRCAQATTEAVSALGIEVRSGLHSGECEIRGGDLGGIAVHTAARVGALAGPSEVLVSRTVVDLVAGSGLAFSERGQHELKGVPGSWQLFSLAS